MYRLYRFIAKEDFDVIITNLFDANVILRIAAILARVPLIISYEHNIYKNKKRWQIFIDKILAKFTYKIFVGAPQVKAFLIKQEKIAEETRERIKRQVLEKKHSGPDTETIAPYSDTQLKRELIKAKLSEATQKESVANAPENEGV